MAVWCFGLFTGKAEGKGEWLYRDQGESVRLDVILRFVLESDAPAALALPKVTT